jgi:hypothetical protein
MTAKSNITNGTKLCLFCPHIPSRNKHAMKAAIWLVKSQFGIAGRPVGRNTLACTAVDETVRVTLADVAVALNVMVLGEERPHVGKLVAPAGGLETAQLRLTEPVNPLTALTVITSVADWPGAGMLIIPVLEERLTPGPGFVTVTTSVADVLPVKLLSPAYTATIL